MVNGKTILSAVQASQSNVIHHGPSGKLNSVGKNGVVSTPNTGLTIIDFIALPARARLTVSFSAQGKNDVFFKSSEGFMGLRKLWQTLGKDD